MNKLQNARIAFLLGSCEKFSQNFYKNILKKYESGKIVSTLHNFKLFIKLNYNEINDNYNKFDIKNTYYHFYNIKSEDVYKSSIYSEWLQYKNNDILTNQEINNIYNKLIKLKINLDVYQFIPILTVATLIKYYANIYKYLFIPVIIDYNRKGYNIYHQAGLIIDFSGKI